MTEKPLYLVMISVHGLIRGHDLELGRDADTGGQTKYVVDLARALAEDERVGQVDLVTRRVVDPAVSDDYAAPVETLSEGARIVRIDAGPDEYLPKEVLWDHLDAFTDNLVEWINAQPARPDAIHGHYADAGYVGVRLAHLLGVPLVQTGHSLGRDKRKRLLAKGLSAEAIEDTYNISRRIHAEEEVLANADLVITSTHNEIDEQYRLYNFYDPNRMAVIPPGTDLKQFYPPEPDESFAFADALSPFLKGTDKPVVLALSRPDERKNIVTLLEAFGESQALREAANLVIVAGNRDDIGELGAGAQSVLTELLLTVDRYDLYGHVALPKHHRPEQVPEIYRLASASRGVFVNPALTEPFGLTLLEAAATGLPVVATQNGGPVDIIANCDNGALVDPLDRDAMATAILELLESDRAWDSASTNGLAGVREHYTWQAHADAYLEQLAQLSGEHRQTAGEWPSPMAGRYRDRALFTDLDQSLLGDPEALPEFAALVRDHRKRMSFGIATGRRIDSAMSAMNRYGLPAPDILISSLGTQIHYGPYLSEDEHWADHIDHHWNRARILRALSDLPGMKLQPRVAQSRFKISWYYDPDEGTTVDEMVELLQREELTANLFCSFGQYIDVVPSRASKGLALRYVALRLGIPLEQILVAGGSGADEDLMRGNTLAVVVANRHDEELSALVDVDRVYFARRPHARGVLEAVEHYGFLDRQKAGGS
ncbi:glycosyltransferase [Marinihelvus fidelis]|uniref:sucrose-phosphate synthase n=1 Tax=Marinihelvus fidelis TaxID=2613842 RepID=A0A5N0TH50_9GAMM|nr:HAD family hydrolase [Marinihelvus fidelis]KAA9132609.1 glycosyltransferase [Marinihelvus fidelis]